MWLYPIMRESALSDLWYKLTWQETVPLMYATIRQSNVQG